MALNPFFLQGSPSEQRLVQELINEQLKIYGVEVTYIPRKFVRRESVIREISSSKFNDNFSIEAYVSNYEGYTGAGDILTKFGMSLKDELILIISKERFEDFISPFLSTMDPNEIVLSSRPREGDLIYFPLGKRIFEVKFVEHEQPFYQLGKTYVYELKCELFEYEDEVGGWDDNDINSTTQEIDEVLEQQGYITALKLFASGQTAEASSQISSGYVRRVIINNDGYDYKQTPIVAISSAPAGGVNASAVAITTYLGGVHSIKQILLTNAGYGYTIPPTITISGGGGVGAAATCEIVTNYSGVRNVSITNAGSGYANPPQVSISSATSGPAISASLVSIANSSGNISQILISDAGIGYTISPTITIAQPPLLVGVGTYRFNEVVTGSISQTKARVKSWSPNSKILKVGIKDGSFVPGEIVVGSASSAMYAVRSYSDDSLSDKYQGNDEIEVAADQIIDFSETNPFGTF